jgi:hypothetical protein
MTHVARPAVSPQGWRRVRKVTTVFFVRGVESAKFFLAVGKVDSGAAIDT